MNLLEKRHFVCSDFEKNSNKFWIISRYDNNSVVTYYGRVGNTGEKTVKNFSSEVEAIKFFNSKVCDKQRVKEGRRDAYTEIEVLEDRIVYNNLASKDIAELAANEIQTTSQDVKEFVKWLAKINIHNITSSTSIRYNISEGTFSTPLGVIGKNTINEAKNLLDQISKFSNIDDKLCISLINQYVRRIPQDLGGSSTKIHAKHVFGTPELLQRQLDIIEGLETAINQVKPVELSETERVFNTKLDICINDNVIGEIKERFSRYSNGNRISRVYEVDIKDVDDRFITIGLPIGNIDRLWHGTKPQHILSIFKGGLQLPPKNYYGNRFGNGVYFSDRSDMSLGYTQTNSRNGKNYRYMFLSDVAKGNVVYTYDGGHSVPKGYHSRWMEKNLNSSQIIVYNTDQIKLLYLVEIEN